MIEAESTTAPAARRDAMLREVRGGLSREQKELSPKYFYDRRGSELFEEITRLPEYYLTRAEIRILQGAVGDWLRGFGPHSLVELGAGSGRKTRLILEGMLRSNGSRPLLYVPVDVSAEFLEASARELGRDYGDVRVRPLVADMSAPDFLEPGGTGRPFPERLRAPSLFALLGSTIGNFRISEAAGLLGRVAGVMESPDRFLLGIDLRPSPDKSLERLERAYDDPGGVTARFNRNVLRVLNRELGTDFDLSAFRHRAFYDEDRHRIEMHLVAEGPQQVGLPDGSSVTFRSGESVRTELSHKYDRATVDALMQEAGMVLDRWLPGDAGLYAMAVGRRRKGDG